MAWPVRTKPSRRSYAGNHASTLRHIRGIARPRHRSISNICKLNLQYRPHPGGTGSKTVWRQSPIGQPRRVPRRSGLSSGTIDAGAPLQVLPGLCSEQVPLGSGARRADWHHHRADRAAPPHRRKVRNLFGSLRQLHGPSRLRGGSRRKEDQGAEGRAAPGPFSRHTCSDSSRSVPGYHQASGLRRAGFGRTSLADAGRETLLRIVRLGRECARRYANRTTGHRKRPRLGHDRRGDDTRGRSSLRRRHRQPFRRLRGYRGH